MDEDLAGKALLLYYYLLFVWGCDDADRLALIISMALTPNP